VPLSVQNQSHSTEDLLPHTLQTALNLKITGESQTIDLMLNRHKEDLNYLNYILENELFALFEQRQWKMDLRTPLGTEILLRIPNVNDTQLYLSTAYWVEFAEVSEKLEILSYKILTKLLRNAHLLNPLHAPYYINIPPPIVSIALVDHVKTLLDKARLPYDFIGIELTERQPILDQMQFKRGIDALQRLKIPVALDDYGRGYATMQFLRDMHVDRVKIDRGLLHDAKVNLSKRLTLVSLLDFANEFNIEVIAEGVEIESDYDFVCKLGCAGVQGFYIDSPTLLIPVNA
jgi:EAL domain-containing protein (putative c-di-GMP-specific phosphodiesterase class I)